LAVQSPVLLNLPDEEWADRYLTSLNECLQVLFESLALLYQGLVFMGSARVVTKHSAATESHGPELQPDIICSTVQ
jgi:hypothetical protein